MEKTTLNDIQGFLRNEGWNYSGSQSNQSFQYNEYPLNYDIVSWKKSSYGTLILYTSVNKATIVLYETEESCFQQLLREEQLRKKGKTNIVNNVLVTGFIEDGITLEFQQRKNSYSGNQYAIFAYNSKGLKKEEEKVKRSARLKENTLNKFDSTNEETNTSEAEINQNKVQLVRGLSSRAFKNKPNFKGHFTEDAKVYVDVKVNAQGAVISVTIAKGTTTSNSQLRNIAIQNAKKITFSSSNEDIESGTLLYVFMTNINEASVKKPDGDNAERIEFQTIFNIKSLDEMYSQFGKKNVVLNMNSDIQIFDFAPTEYIIYKNTINEFSILFDNNKVGGIVLRQNYKGNLLSVPFNLKAGLSLNAVADINKGVFTFNIFLRNLNWLSGSLENYIHCFDIYFAPSVCEFSQFYNEMLPKYNLIKQIKYNDENIKRYDIRVNKIIFFCPS
jgi:hypothetical protein